jgi:ABC-type branched-subunit amino acid transport system substrate-binding protein
MRKLTTRRWAKVTVPFVTLALVAAACGGDDDDEADATTPPDDTAEATTPPEATEPEATEPEATEPEATEPEATEPAPPADILTDFGVTDDTIRIGLNADLSGIFAPLVIQIVDGQEAYWEIVNENGGIAGRQVELVVLDNAYDVPTHLENYEEMAAESADGVVMFSQSTGSPHTAATAEALVDDNLLAIPLSWYSGWADPAIGENVTELYTSYCLESMNGLTYLAGAQDASTVAIISFPGEYGQDGAVGAKAAAEALGLEVVYDGEGAVVPGSDQTPVITELVNAQPDLVWATINPTTLAEIMGGAYAQGLQAQWSGNSPTYNFQLLGTDLGPVLDEFYTHSTYTQLWNSADVPGMTEMVEGMRAKRPEAPVSDVYIVSWTEGYATQQILEKAAANGDLTRAGIVAAAKDPDLEIDFKGLSPNQTFSGEPNDYIVRESFVYDVDISKFTPTGTVSDDDAGTGFTLLDGPFVSDTAANYDFQGACFVPSG